LISAPIQTPFDENGQPSKVWLDWASAISRQAKYRGEFTTANRPTDGLNDGDWGMESTLGHVVFYYSSGWTDAAGSSV